MKFLLSMFLTLALLLVGATVLYNQFDADPLLATQEESEPEEQAEEPEPVLAPDFLVYDSRGEGVRLSDFLGTPVVLNFWASWCSPCKSEMPGFQAAYEDLGDQVAFLMVNATDGSRETVDTASSYIAGQGYTFPVYYDTAYEASITYGVYGLPTTFLINAQGEVVAQAASAIDEETLRRGIDMILPGG